MMGLFWVYLGYVSSHRELTLTAVGVTPLADTIRHDASCSGGRGLALSLSSDGPNYCSQELQYNLELYTVRIGAAEPCRIMLEGIRVAMDAILTGHS